MQKILIIFSELYLNTLLIKVEYIFLGTLHVLVIDILIKNCAI